MLQLNAKPPHQSFAALALDCALYFQQMDTKEKLHSNSNNSQPKEHMVSKNEAMTETSIHNYFSQWLEL